MEEGEGRSQKAPSWVVWLNFRVYLLRVLLLSDSEQRCQIGETPALSAFTSNRYKSFPQIRQDKRKFSDASFKLRNFHFNLKMYPYVSHVAILFIFFPSTLQPYFSNPYLLCCNFGQVCYFIIGDILDILRLFCTLRGAINEPLTLLMNSNEKKGWNSGHWAIINIYETDRLTLMTNIGKQAKT